MQHIVNTWAVSQTAYYHTKYFASTPLVSLILNILYVYIYNIPVLYAFVCIFKGFPLILHKSDTFIQSDFVL